MIETKKHREFIKENRQIRVFISSSFEDMDSERDYLRDEIFPRLQEQARQRSVAITALDLRWGIPEGTDLSETIEICMKEIDNSYPFFIGLLGKCYGTQPSKQEIYDTSEVLQNQFSSLERYFRERLSITEMEMRYGIIDRSQEEKKLMDAVFFLRASDSEEVKRHPRLSRLWNDINNCSNPYNPSIINASKVHIWAKEYDTLEELGKAIVIVFNSILDRLYPKIDVKDELLIERYRQHATLIELSRFHIPQQEYLDKISYFVFSGCQRVLSIRGESGCGKSSLLAFWINSNKSMLETKQINVLYHFIGSDIGDVRPTSIIKRLTSEIIQLYSIEIKTEDKVTFDFVLNKISHNTKQLLIVIDAVNQLNTDKPLGWLPQRIPERVKIIYSTTFDSLLNNTNSRGKLVEDSFVLPGIHNITIRKSIVDQYLYDFHRRKLVSEEVDCIINWPLSANPLALRVLLDELLAVGKYNKMMDVIQKYTSIMTIDTLLSTILIRIASKPHYYWVSEALRYISLSLYGLSEDELLKLVDMHQLYWSSFYCSFKRHFVVRNGLLSFSHIYMREAVKREFVDTINDDTIYHSKLILLFKKCESLREIEELYHHSILANSYGPALYNVLCCPRNFFHFWEKDSNQLISVFSNYLNQGYNPPKLAVKHEELELYRQEEVGYYCYYGAYGKAVLSFSHYLSINQLFLQMYEEINRWFTEEGSAANDWIPIHKEAGFYYMERGLYRKAIQTFKYGFLRGNLFGPGGRKIGYSDDEEPEIFYTGCWIVSYYMIGECYRRLGEYDLAISFLEKAIKEGLEVIEESGQTDGLADIYYSLSRIYLEKGEKEKSENYFNKCYEQTGSLETWAEIYYATGSSHQAFLLFHEELKKHRTLVNRNNEILGKDYYWIGKSYFFEGQFDLAIRCLHKSLTFYDDNEITNILIADVEFWLGACFYNQKKYQDAYKHYSKASDIYKEYEVHPQWMQSERAAAIMLYYLRRYQEGKTMLERLLKSISGTSYCTPYREEELKSLMLHFK